MKKVSVAAFALLVSSGFAHAADMPMAPLPVKLWTWTGLYMGGHFGGAWGDSDWFDLGAGNIGSQSPSGILGGTTQRLLFERAPAQGHL